MEQRYFVGITLPKELSQVISKVQHELLIPRRILTPLAPHITLLEPHLLEATPPDAFIPQVKRVCEIILPIKVMLTRTNCFNKHVLYIEAKNDELFELRKELLNLLSEPSASQQFQPHVTLAQTKPNQILTETLIETYRERVEPLLPISFAVDQLSYFEWVHPRTYALYNV